MPIDGNETLIEGNWEFVDGRMIPNSAVKRIRSLINDELTKIAVASSGWETLYRDPHDGRFWELTYLHGEMHGGGPESLRFIDVHGAEQKYGIRSE